MEVIYSGLVILYKICQNITIKQLMQNSKDDDIKKYNSGEFVLDPGNLVAKQMEIHDVIEDTYTEWIEF